uniref:C-type lectin n=1 Tax=Fredericella sultana TaxID=349672 RepID=I4E998_9BILA|nr:C-type lectin [Fredericella sultana]
MKIFMLIVGTLAVVRCVTLEDPESGLIGGEGQQPATAPEAEQLYIRMTYGGSDYVFVRQQMSWQKAEGNCLKLGMRLVKIDDFNERNWLRSVIESRPNLQKRHYWIGLHSLTYSYQFFWTCGFQQPKYLSWASGEPNSEDDFCVHLDHGRNYDWNNERCHVPLATTFSICETCTLSK